MVHILSELAADPELTVDRPPQDQLCRSSLSWLCRSYLSCLSIDPPPLPFLPTYNLSGLAVDQPPLPSPPSPPTTSLSWLSIDPPSPYRFQVSNL